MRSLAALLVPVLLCAVALVARGEDQPAPAAAAPAKAEDAASDTMAQVINQPRTVDTMARFWMVLYDACEAAGVPPSAVYVVAPDYDAGLNQTMGAAAYLDSAGMRTPTSWKASPRRLALGVAPAHFPALLEALTVTCGRPWTFLPQAKDWNLLYTGRELESFCAIWQYVYSWPKTNSLVAACLPPVSRGTMDGDPTSLLRAPGVDVIYQVQQFSLEARPKKAEVTPAFAAVTQKYGVPRTPVQ